MPINDDEKIVTEMTSIWQSSTTYDVAFKVLGNTNYWGQDLNSVKGITQAVSDALELLEKYGVKEGFLKFT